ncbi:MAG: hypothetical protein M1827_003763 [Pycnora praestabilis]|nr:MAG: hypothetical protein M1827_003763 [Pycnora praestabilis]
MSLHSFLRHSLLLLLPLSVISTTYLYLYPVFHGCAFPSPKTSSAFSYLSTLEQHTGHDLYSCVSIPPFRLLTLGDPQLEGDSSLPSAEDTYKPILDQLQTDITDARSTSRRLQILGFSAVKFVLADISRVLQLYRKRLDLLGNDYYLAHIYRTIYWWTKPTHITVLGDLLGSQWVSDQEFEWRGWRFWNRVLTGSQKVDDEVSGQPVGGPLGEDRQWKTRVINVAGNHDVGYAGDMTKERIERFERVFGKANWDVSFSPPPSPESTSELAEDTVEKPELRVVVLNSLNLDTPALESDLQVETYDYINQVIGTSRPVEDKSVATILLTHLPLHKEDGICVDGPFFDFHSGDSGNGVKEQNHISYEAGKGILQGIFGMSANPDAPGGGLGRRGIILTGHDHEGCDVYHHIPSDAERDGNEWKASKWADAGGLVNESIPGIREITVRSMMGDFGGNAGLLSAWFDADVGEWQFEYATCAIGVQHIWWAIHALDLVTLGTLSAILVGYVAIALPKEVQTPNQRLQERRKRSLPRTSKPVRMSSKNPTVSNMTASREGIVAENDVRGRTPGTSSS